MADDPTDELSDDPTPERNEKPTDMPEAEPTDPTRQPPDDMTEGWTRVGNAVRERRNHLRISQGAGGVSAATWRKIEKAIDPPYRKSTVLAVCRTLGWSPDSFERILEGHEPVETRPVQATPESKLEERVAALEAEVGWIKLELAALDVPTRQPRTGRPGGEEGDGQPPAGTAP